MKLQGRVALVTGAGRGIGRAIALGLGREGADVAVNYSKSKDAAEEVAREIRHMGRRAIAVRGDVSDAASVDSMVQAVTHEFGRIDILVNNAGVLRRQAFFDIALSDWDWTIGTNVRGVFIVSQRVAKVMRDQGAGTIVNVASVFSRNASPGATAYAVSKAAVSMLTRQMAIELAQYGIRVNEINPGLTETDLNRNDIAKPEFREPRLARIPLHRIGQPDDLAGAVAFLASDDAGMITGASIFIDGGASIW
jgi:NAD(P)-dependent dehydrogenase (short-subunit alcohol dehydrogenase family)